MILCWSMAVKSGVNQGLYLSLVQQFLNGACLFKIVRKALLKSNQAPVTDGMRSKSFQDTWARSIRKACSLKGFRERLTVMRGGRLTVDSLCTQAMTQCSLRSWLKTAEVYLEGKLVRMISKRMPMVTDLGLYRVGSLIICVRLRESRLDCRTASLDCTYPSLVHLSVQTLKKDGGQSIHIWCPGHT